MSVVTFSDDDDVTASALTTPPEPESCISITDNLLYSTLMPSFETVFAGRTFQRFVLVFLELCYAK
jgi:hypothetical protein